MPELSYGSHIFQDLVEAGILYTAVFKDESTLQFCPELLNGMPDLVKEYTNEAEQVEGIIRICDAAGSGLTLYYDMSTEHVMAVKV